MKRKMYIIGIISIVLISVCQSGCSKKSPLTPDNPVTLTMWHNFGAGMQNSMDMLIDEFNSTIGKEEGIIINVTAISSSKELQEKLDMIVNNDPGAPVIPDIFTAYPKTAIKFQTEDMIINFNDYFSEKELESYVPSFLEEGCFGEGNDLYVFPFAKSTEVLYLNCTLFDRFAADSDVKVEDLATIEGLVDASCKYYDWTDSMTPDVVNDGKMFFTADSWLNFAQTALVQQDTELFQDTNLDLDQDAYLRLWNLLYPAVIKGGIAIYDGYSSDLSKTGDIICSTGSTAGIIFYGDTITYPDNTTEKVVYDILPYPIMKDGAKAVIQRGNGLCVAKSTNAKEYAASLFIKWFTSPQQNMQFISSTGYLPVTNTAFSDQLQNNIATVTDNNIKKMLLASVNMYNEYEFFTAPLFDNFDEIGKNYESSFKERLRQDHEAYLSDTSLDILEMSKKSQREILFPPIRR